MSISLNGVEVVSPYFARTAAPWPRVRPGLSRLRRRVVHTAAPADPSFPVGGGLMQDGVLIQLGESVGVIDVSTRQQPNHHRHVFDGHVQPGKLPLESLLP